MDEQVINKYVIHSYDGYVDSFWAVGEDSEEYNFVGQMADYPDVCEGWYKFIPNTEVKGEGCFVEDSVKKAEIIAERERRSKEPTDFDRFSAQAVYTALMTDTLLSDEENI